MKITVRDITKRYGAFTALQNVSLEVPQGKLVALLGPSGSGKTTLLRVIAGLEAPDSGSVLYEQDDVTQRAAKERNVGFVFQHYALFGHMTIFENIAFGLRVRKWKNEAVRERVMELCASFNWKAWKSGCRRSFRADSASAWRWRAPSRRVRKCCCWTSRLARSMPKCAPICGAGFASCTTKSI